MNASDRVTDISIGIFAFNEVASIEACLTALQRQRRHSFRITEIVVVSTTSTDGTDDVVRRLAEHDPRIRLLVETERHGKLFSVLHYLSEASQDICILLSADVVSAPDCLEHLVCALLSDERCAMAGPQIVSVPPAGNVPLASRLNVLLWRLLHEVALRDPKLGELVALRRSFMTTVPTVAGCDEVMLEIAARSAGGTLAYVPAAIVSNRSVATMPDYLDVRTRVHAQHLIAKRSLHYTPSTMKWSAAVPACVTILRQQPTALPLLGLLSAVEAVARARGRLWHWRRHDTYIWQPSQSTRRDGP